MMEIDMHSPSFRTTRSAKRARSPPSPSPVDRPLKRPSRGVNSHVAIPLPVSVTRRPRAQEDWVAQTRGLRIASPGFGLERVVEDAARDGAEEDAPLADTDMADEDTGGDDVGDEQMMSISPPRPHPPQHVMPPSDLQPPQYLRLPEALYPASTTQHQQHGHQLRIPSIQVHAATPSPIQIYQQSPLGAQPQHLCVSASPAQTQGHVQGHTVGVGRRQRFTMGPRADCEKCRLGVKGHWMHFD